MKKSAKVLSLVLVLALVMATLTACGGIDVSKIKGDWKVSTINEDYLLHCCDCFL